MRWLQSSLLLLVVVQACAFVPQATPSSAAAKPPCSAAARPLSRGGGAPLPSSVWSTAAVLDLPPSELDRHIAFDAEYSKIQRLHTSPDVFIVDDFLSPIECDDLIDAAVKKGLEQSPTVYAGWSQDVAELLRLATLGPITWAGLLRLWLLSNAGASKVEAFVGGLEVWFGGVVITGLGLLAWAKKREMNLQGLRTSTSTTVKDLNRSRGAEAFVRKAEGLLRSDPSTFEAPTVIRYEPGQVLRPHYDANVAADFEDQDRGGQTLATLIVYLNDAEEGGRGKTRFGKLTEGGVGESRGGEEGEGPLEVEPRRGRALLFFPANENGKFDGRLEHEGCEAGQEKWIARIWRHQSAVAAPYGLSD